VSCLCCLHVVSLKFSFLFLFPFSVSAPAGHSPTEKVPLNRHMCQRCVADVLRCALLHCAGRRTRQTARTSQRADSLSRSDNHTGRRAAVWTDRRISTLMHTHTVNLQAGLGDSSNANWQRQRGDSVPTPAPCTGLQSSADQPADQTASQSPHCPLRRSCCCPHALPLSSTSLPSPSLQ